MTEEGHLPPRDDRRTEAATFMEHWALAEVLPVKRMARRAAPLYFLFTLVNLAILLNFSIYFSFCYNNSFKAQRAGLRFLFKNCFFLRMHGNKRSLFKSS